MDLSKVNRNNTKELEVFFREHLNDSNFLNYLVCNYNYLSVDFLREIKPQFIKICKKMDYKDRWYFKYTRDMDFYYEMFGRDY